MSHYLTDSQLKRQVRFHNSAVLERGRVLHIARCAVCGHTLNADDVTAMNVLRSQHREKHRWTEGET